MKKKILRFILKRRLNQLINMEESIIKKSSPELLESITKELRPNLFTDYNQGKGLTTIITPTQSLFELTQALNEMSRIINPTTLPSSDFGKWCIPHVITIDAFITLSNGFYIEPDKGIAKYKEALFKFLETTHFTRGAELGIAGKIQYTCKPLIRSLIKLNLALIKASLQ